MQWEDIALKKKLRRVKQQKEGYTSETSNMEDKEKQYEESEPKVRPQSLVKKFNAMKEEWQKKDEARVHFTSWNHLMVGIPCYYAQQEKLSKIPNLHIFWQSESLIILLSHSFAGLTGLAI